jgi:hypothetical protein
MTDARKMLLETLAGHIALLHTKDPQKAATPVVKETERYVKMALRMPPPRRLAA